MNAATSYLTVLFLVWFTGGSCWKQLPKIPAGRRTEYHLQQADGSYKYGYDTGEGSSSVVDADASNNLRGRFQYVDGVTGRKIALAYTAGPQGFVPEEVVASPDGSVQRETGSAAATSFEDPDYDANADASYSFNIDTDSYKRTESADSRGNVRGKYSYRSREGGSHGVSYIAGENTGFVVTALDSSEVAGDPVNSDGSYFFGLNTADQSRKVVTDAKSSLGGGYPFRSKDDDKTRRVDYGLVARGDDLSKAALPTVYLAPVLAAPAGTIIQPDGSYSFSFGGGDHPQEKNSGLKKTGLLAAVEHLPVTSKQSDIKTSTVIEDSDNSPGDASYSFSYNAEDHGRQESSDSSGNVRGTFSFIAPDGVSRQVDYEAGAMKGFLAKGSHLPIAPNPEDVAEVVPHQAAETTAYSGSVGTSGVQPDGSYSFSYNTADQSREESVDPQNNVRGSYSFREKDDGKVRRVQYKAGAKTGFVATGDHLPVAPDSAVAVGAIGLPSATGVNTDASSGGDGSYSFGYNAAGADVKSRRVDYDGGATPASGSVSNSHLASLTGAENGAKGNAADGSYSFSYDTSDQSRQESGDAAGNVRGRFSFLAKDDGQRRNIEYEAGANTGFVAKGAHIPSVSSIPSSSYSTSNDNEEDAGGTGDASYSYSYETDSSSKSESSDSAGNVKGVYSYKSGDGITRTLKYTSRGNEGFVVNEDIGAPAFVQAPVVSPSPSRTVGGRNFVLHKYLPPENKHKFGYILDTTA